MAVIDIDKIGDEISGALNKKIDSISNDFNTIKGPEDLWNFLKNTLGISTQNDFIDADGNKLFEFDFIGSWRFDNDKEVSQHATATGYSVTSNISHNIKTMQVDGWFYEHCQKESDFTKAIRKLTSTASGIMNILGRDTQAINSIINAYSKVLAVTSLLQSISQLLYSAMSMLEMGQDQEIPFFDRKNTMMQKIQLLDKLADAGVIFDIQPYGMKKKSYVIQKNSISISPSSTDNIANVSLNFVEYIKADDNLYGTPSRSIGGLSSQAEQQKKIAEVQAQKSQESMLYQGYKSIRGNK